MNSYIKYIIERLDFNSAIKLKKPVNVHDIIFKYRLNEIVLKILNNPTLNPGSVSRIFYFNKYLNSLHDI